MNPKMTAVDAAGFLGITLQGLHKNLKTKDLAFEKQSNRVFFSHDTARSLFNLKFKSKIVTMQIVKGGTGKTSLVFNIGVRAALYGAKVLLVDLDQQGNLTQALKVNSDDYNVMLDIISKNKPIEEAIVKVAPGLDLIPSSLENSLLDNTLMLGRFPLDRIYKDAFNRLRSQYDLIIIDCPPALGQSVAAATLASDVVIAPVTPERFCLSGLKITHHEIQNLGNSYKKNIPVRIVINKFDGRTHLSHEVLQELIKHPTYGEILYKSYVRSTQDFPNSIAKGVSIFDTLRESAAREDIDLLAKEILDINPEITLANELRETTRQREASL